VLGCLVRAGSTSPNFVKGLAARPCILSFIYFFHQTTFHCSSLSYVGLRRNVIFSNLKYVIDQSPFFLSHLILWVKKSSLGIAFNLLRSSHNLQSPRLCRTAFPEWQRFNQLLNLETYKPKHEPKGIYGVQIFEPEELVDWIYFSDLKGARYIYSVRNRYLELQPHVLLINSFKY
jgi:hypothetical protein